MELSADAAADAAGNSAKLATAVGVRAEGAGDAAASAAVVASEDGVAGSKIVANLNSANS